MKLKAHAVPVGSVVSAPFGSGHVEIKIVYIEPAKNNDYIIWWDDCSYSYWVERKRKVKIIELADQKTQDYWNAQKDLWEGEPPNEPRIL